MSSQLRAYAVASLACLLAVFPSSSASGAFPGQSGRIAFSLVTRSADIYSIRADGSGLRRLTTHRKRDGAPSWSPDGRRIAYRCYGSDRADRAGDICVMRRDGSHVRRLTSGPAIDDAPSWSPSGKDLVFERYVEEDPLNTEDDLNYELYRVSLPDRTLTRLTSSPGRDQSPRWSPDGTRIVFSSFRTGNWDVWMMNADGTMQMPIATGPSTEWTPEWKPDGERIAFSRFESDDTRGGSYNIYTMNPDGTDQQLVGNSKQANGISPAWSPDGNEIVVMDLWRNNPALFVLAADGSARRRLFVPGVTPTWQPR